jgi:outer membrane protein TolC
MTRSTRWLLFLFLAVGSTRLAARAEEAPRLTLTTAVARALERYPALVAARSRMAENDQSVGEVAASRGPLVSLSLLGQQNGEPLPVTPIHGFGLGKFPDFDRTLGQASLNLTYTLVDFGARAARVAQAEALAAAGGAELSTAEQAVVARVAATWAQIFARAEDLAAQQQRAAAVGAELERVGKLLAAGKVAEVESLRAEASLAATEAEVTRAVTALDASERDLARLLGAEPAATRVSLLTPLTPALAVAEERQTLVARAVDASPQVAQARHQVAAAEAAVALARTAYYPTLKASGVLQELGSPGVTWETEWNVGVQLAVPLWDGGQTGHRVARAAARVDTARASLAQTTLDVSESVDRALAAQSEATARLDALSHAERRLGEVARIQKLLLDTGAGTQVDYLGAEAELASLRASLAAARASALVARVDLARATGALDLAWLETNLTANPETRP